MPELGYLLKLFALERDSQRDSQIFTFNIASQNC